MLSTSRTRLLCSVLAGPLIALTTLLVRAQEPPNQPAQERRLGNLRQLTFGGQNAEAYFSSDTTKIIFQSTRPPYECDQIFSMNIDGTDVRLLNSGKGRTTCGFFFADGQRIIYASTHLTSAICPPQPDRSQGYVWPIYPSYEIFTANIDGTGVKRLTKNPGYDAEGTISPDGRKIVFTSMRGGDLEIYSMNVNGSGVKRLTNQKGYDGGPFFSWDGKTIVYRAYHPKSKEEMTEYETLLKQNLIKPTRAEIFMMAPDGSHKRQITNNGAANWAPFLHPNNRQIISHPTCTIPTEKAFLFTPSMSTGPAWNA